MAAARTAARRSFAKGVLDEAYITNLKARAAAGELPPQVEVLLLHYLLGKPTEELEITDGGHDLQDMSTEELLAAAKEIEQTLARAVAEQEPVPPPVANPPNFMPPGGGGAVH